MVYQLAIFAYILKKDQDALKNYLIACEYLQLDPSKPYDIAFIKERASRVLSEWNGTREYRKMHPVLEKYLGMMDSKGLPPTMAMMENMKIFEPGEGPHAFQTGVFWGKSKPKIYEFQKLSIQEQFAKRCSNLIKDGKLEILPGTVNEEYVKKEPRQDNFDNYTTKFPKWPN